MNVLILDGSLENTESLAPAREALTTELKKRSWDFEHILLHQRNIRACIGCFRCWHTTPGICSGVAGDDAEDIIRKTITCRLLIFFTPLMFGGYSSELKKIIERFLGLLQPGITLINGESHHKKRYDRYPSILSMGLHESPEDEEVELFKRLAYRHSLNFYPPWHRGEVFRTSDIDLQSKIGVILDDLERQT